MSSVPLSSLFSPVSSFSSSVHLRAHLSASHVPAHLADRSTAPLVEDHSSLDFPSLLLDDWLASYVADRRRFHSAILMCETKLKEIRALANSHNMQPNTAEQRSSPRISPSHLRTAVCLDLLDCLLIEMWGCKLRGEPRAESLGIPILLARIRDQLIEHIYTGQIPKDASLEHYLLGLDEPVDRLPQLVAGESMQQRQTREHRQAEYKEYKELSTPLGSSVPITFLPVFLRLVPYFTSLPHQLQKNSILRAQVEAIEIPSHLHRLRLLQKKIIEKICSKWGKTLLAWNFYVWKSQSKSNETKRVWTKMVRKQEENQTNKQAAQPSTVAASAIPGPLTRQQRIIQVFLSRILRLKQKLIFVAWFLQVLLARQNSLIERRDSGIAAVKEAEKSLAELNDQISGFRISTAQLEEKNSLLTSQVSELRTANQSLESQVKNSSDHQSQCLAILQSLNEPIQCAVQSIQRQIDRVEQRDSASFQPVFEQAAAMAVPNLEHSVHRLIQTGLRSPSRTAGSSKNSTRPASPSTRSPHGESSAAAESQPVDPLVQLSMLINESVSSSPSARVSVVADFIAAWLSLQLKLCRSGSATENERSKWLASPANQQRLVAALVRVQQLGTKPSMNLLPPSFPPPDLSKSGDSVKRGTGRLADKSNLQRPKLSLTELSSSIDGGTITTPFSVFQNLSDSDTNESVLCACLCLFLADSAINNSLASGAVRLAPNDSVIMQKLRAASNSLMGIDFSSPDAVKEHSAAVNEFVQLLSEGIRVENETSVKIAKQETFQEDANSQFFKVSIKALTQAAKKSEREREQKAAGLLESSIKSESSGSGQALVQSLADTIDVSSVSRSDVNEVENLIAEFSKELYKIFAFYCSPGSPANGGASAADPASLTLGNGEFWRFVRDCKFNLPHAALIDLVFMKAAEWKAGQSQTPREREPNLERRKSTVEQLMELGAVDSPDATSPVPTILSPTERSQYMEKHKQQQLARLNFRQFLASLLRLAVIKFPNEKFVARRFKQLITAFILNPNSRAMKFNREQQETANAQSNQMNALNSAEVEAVYRRHNTLLRAIFGVYARITPNFMVMTFNDCLAFTRDFELLHKNITVHEMRALFSCVQTDDKEAEEDSEAWENSTTAAASTHGKELTFRQFLEFLTALSHFVLRNPYLTLHDRIEKFVSGVLKTRKLPLKTYRM